MLYAHHEGEGGKVVITKPDCVCVCSVIYHIILLQPLYYILTIFTTITTTILSYNFYCKARTHTHSTRVVLGNRTFPARGYFFFFKDFTGLVNSFRDIVYIVFICNCRYVYILIL